MLPLNKHTKTKTPKQTHKTKKQKQITIVYTPCDVNTEDNIRQNIDLMTSPSRVYIPKPLGTIIK